MQKRTFMESSGKLNIADEFIYQTIDGTKARLEAAAPVVVFLLFCAVTLILIRQVEG